MIEAVIARPDAQAQRVDSLVDYCRKLDGTRVRVIPITKREDAEYRAKYPNASFASLQSSGLRRCAIEMRGKPFFWLEPDSVPLRPGWLEEISQEYHAIGKPFLLSEDSHPPHDLVGGIGVYSGDTHWVIPEFFPERGWDAWMVKHISPLISKTSLIQHRYGVYDYRGFCRPNVFPMDRSSVRHGAAVFHADKFHGLINDHTSKSQTFVHSGDLGDIIAALPVIRHLGGGHLVITDHNLPREQPVLRAMKPRFHLIEELLAAQPYIRSVRFESNGAFHGTHDFRPFRRKYRRDRTLAESQADWLGVQNLGMDPWLRVSPSQQTSGRIVVAKSQRYHNPRFPWRMLVAKHGKRMVFIGHDAEHREFCSAFGHVEHLPTPTLMDAAKAIAGSDLFIGNQSSPCWIAMGLGHALIQETHDSIWDSRVQRSNARFVTDGVVPAFPTVKQAVA